MLPSLILGLICAGAVLLQEAKPAGAPTTKQVDPILQDQYNAMRAKAPNTADGHWKVGMWCEQKGLKDLAETEFMIVCQLDPGREAAWKKLGYLKQKGKWTTAANIAAERAEVEAQRKADAHWRPLIQKWKAGLAHKDKRAESEKALAGVTDPRAVPSIWKAFATGGADDQEVAVDILGHIDGERPSRALAGLAILGKTDVIRRAATETLARRNYMGILMNWIGLLHEPIKYEVKQVAGPGMPGTLFVEGEQFNVRRFYMPPTASQIGESHAELIPEGFLLPLKTDSPPPWPPKPGAKQVGIVDGVVLFMYDYTWAPKTPPPKYKDPTGAYQTFELTRLQAQINAEFQIQEAAKVAAGAQAQLAHDVDVIEATNGTIRERNARVAEALRRVSGKDLGEDREAWLKWWLESRGYKYIPPKDRDKPTLDMQVALPYFPSSGPARVANGNGVGNAGYCMIYDHEQGKPPRLDKCFGAGTRVWTPAGAQVIETIRCGDRVLTGNVTAGTRQVSSVISVHRSTAPRTLCLIAGGETIVTTEGHPFAKVGIGWTRAGDLQPGDELLANCGPVRIESVEIGAARDVWNLKLAEVNTYLVGRLGTIVHDITPVADGSR
jgi:Pretoxin HINT domain